MLKFMAKVNWVRGREVTMLHVDPFKKSPIFLIV